MDFNVVRDPKTPWRTKIGSRTEMYQEKPGSVKDRMSYKNQDGSKDFQESSSIEREPTRPNGPRGFRESHLNQERSANPHKPRDQIEI